MSFKDKFHVNPQHDSEGFTMPDAKCAGCDGYECEDGCAYPLRNVPMPWCDHCQGYHHHTARCISLNPLRWPVPEGMKLAAELLSGEARVVGINPKGWQEVDGVQLPAITWAELTDEQLDQMFQLWLHSRTRPAALHRDQREEVANMLRRFAVIDAQGVEVLSDGRAPDVFVGRR